MKKTVLFLAGLLVVFSMATALTPKEIDNFLRNHTEQGYRFIRSSGDNLWYVAFRLPDWKSEWSVVVAFTKDNQGAEILDIGTTVARSASLPSASLLKYLLEKNNDDLNLGSFSLFYEKEYAIQYFARVPNKFLTADELLYYVGFVTAYCNKMEPEVAKFLN